VVFGIVVILAALLVLTPGTVDVDVWARWLHRVDLLGIRGAYRQTWLDYPPGALVALTVFDALPGDTVVITKALAAVCLVATAVLLVVWFRTLDAATVAIAALALNGLGLAALDLTYAPWLVAALMMLHRGRLGWCSALFATACAFKWQPLLLLPYLAVYVIGLVMAAPRARRAGMVARAVVPGAAVACAVAATLGARASASSFRHAISHDILSGKALNLGWIATGFADGMRWLHGPVRVIRTDGVAPWIPIAMRSLLVVLTAVVVVAFWRGARTFGQLLVAGISGVLVYVTCNLGVHENHLFVACVLAVIALWIVPRFRVELTAVIVLANVNLLVFYGPGVTGWPRTIGAVDVTVPLAAVAVLGAAVLVARFLPYLSDAEPEDPPVTGPARRPEASRGGGAPG